jgi:UDP-N-acetylmuramate: L-alanyl-gamma-D-glutamyl-meso-diaminopimelate ligase
MDISLNPALNRIPDKARAVHLIAVCGTAMGALACMLKDIGLRVTGSDDQIYPPMSAFLADRGISMLKGFDPAHLQPPPDLVVIGNAVRRENPEALAVARLGLPYCSLPQALNHFAARGKKALVVAGTHGKTTTASLLAWVLYHAGRDPSFVIGGLLSNFESNFRLGNGQYIVIEGDEYDTAFFDKGSKFLHFDPVVAILTSVEFDHADIFTDLDHVIRAFAGFTGQLKPGSLLMAAADEPIIDALTAGLACETQRYGRTGLWRPANVAVRPPWTVFDVYRGGDFFGRFQSPLMGAHNLANTLAVIAAGSRLGLSAQTMAEALAGFRGVKRRQQVRGMANGITVMDDFAHHPTAVKATIAAVRPHFPDGRLIAVFEPRTNTSMRSVFQDIYPTAFDGADLVCIRRPPLLEKIPSDQRFSAEKLVADLAARGIDAHFFADTDAIIAFLQTWARPADLILVMSNGGFDNIHHRLLQALGKS